MGHWSSLRRYPAALPLYAVEAVAAGAENYPLLRSLLIDHRISEPFSTEPSQPILNHAACRVLHHEGAQVFFETQRGRTRKTPASERIQSILAAQIGELFDDDSDLQRSFDRFEIVVALVSVALGNHPPPGCFVWRQEHGRESLSQYVQKIIDAGLKHPIYQLGVFEDVETFKRIAEAVRSSLSRLSF